MEALGFIQHWGYTPAINCFDKVDNVDVEKDDQEINILMSETSGDGRHIFKSLCDILPLKKQRENPINIYFHEKDKENLARLVLFLTLFCETGISQRERMEMYLDLFANTLIRDKTSAYLEETARELIALVTEDEKKCKSVLKDVINFETLKFKDRDDLEEIFSSYLTCHAFDIETLRDHRLRGHFGQRYDHRKNLVDWDYNMSMKDYAPYVNQLEYRKWRLSGVAYETRLATGSIPNRTLGSFVPGKNRKTKDNILVRGFWGDIINSPYMGYGQEVWESEARTRFFKKVNYQSVYSNSDVTEYNVQAYIHKFEDMDMYEHGFEKLKHILGDDYYDPKTKEKMRKEREQKKKLEEEAKVKINSEEPMIEEITDD